jgi:hypothetical protein
MKKLIFGYDVVNCPSAEELIDFREGKLVGERVGFVRHHLTVCLLCEATLLRVKDSGKKEPVRASAGLMSALNRIARQVWDKTAAKELSARAAGK